MINRPKKARAITFLYCRVNKAPATEATAGGDKELMKIGTPAFKVAGIKSSGCAVNVHADPPRYISSDGGKGEGEGEDEGGWSRGVICSRARQTLRASSLLSFLPVLHFPGLLNTLISPPSAAHMVAGG